jgi:hypothetical protein
MCNAVEVENFADSEGHDDFVLAAEEGVDLAKKKLAPDVPAFLPVSGFPQIKSHSV